MIAFVNDIVVAASDSAALSLIMKATLILTLALGGARHPGLLFSDGCGLVERAPHPSVRAPLGSALPDVR